MANGDQLLRGYAVLSSLKTNLPDQYEVEAEWVRRFNTAVETVEQGSGMTIGTISALLAQGLAVAPGPGVNRRPVIGPA